MVVTTVPFLMTMQEQPHAYAECYHVMLWRWYCPFGKRYLENAKEQVALVTKTGLNRTPEIMSTLMPWHWVTIGCAMLILKAMTTTIS